MKPWISDIESHVEDWSARLPGRGWWPRYVYHYADLPNAISILDAGKLYSRTQVQKRALQRTDAACPAVISQTLAGHREYARLYFRPRTPTQFRNEGIRPKHEIWESAHCPVPVFFCFDAATVLAMDATRFSDGNMGSSRVAHGDSRSFFRDIPFRHVFHSGPVTPEEASTITFHRNAEVLVPDALELRPSLRMIVCRSVAERATLLHLLPEALRGSWSRLIRLGYEDLFERKWTFVESVTPYENVLTFGFNPSSRAPGPFKVEFFYQETGTSTRRAWVKDQMVLDRPLRFNLKGARRGVATLGLDECLAFCGEVHFEDVPF